MKNCKAKVMFFIKMGSSRALSLDSSSVTLATYQVNNTTGVQTCWLDFIAEDRLLKATTSKIMTRKRDRNSN